MGAANFRNIEVATDAKTAFSRARENAQWEFGHGGYTGTIAEKYDFVYCGKLGYNDDGKVENFIHDVLDASYEKWDDKTKSWRVDPKAKEKAIERIPERLRKQVLKAAPIYDDKWGPAVCFKLTGKRAKEWKERFGRKGTHDSVYLFTGMASS